MNICIFCSANNLKEKYTNPAKELARLLSKNGHDLVWGGSDHGLMKVIADGMQQGGSKLIGITVEFLKKYARKNIDELVVAKDISERKKILFERSDAFVVLTGGLGTIDEVTEVLELKKENIHSKPIFVLNTEGFFDGLKQQLQRISDEGFLPEDEHYGVKFIPLHKLIKFADSPADVIKAISEYDK